MKKRFFYNDIYNLNISLISNILKKENISPSDAWNEFYKLYIDPDNYPLYPEHPMYKRYINIDCTADGLLSIKRIYQHEGFNESFLNSYKLYRNFPIIFFPPERNGINMSRYAIFGDRIDHTLFDLKNYFSNDQNKKNSCKLYKAFNRPKTNAWLNDEIKNFENYIDWLGIKGIFTDQNYEIYDLECNNQDLIKSYANTYSKVWTEQYYKNIKKKINLFKKTNE